MKGLKYNKYDGKCGRYKTFYFSKNGSCRSINRLRFMAHTKEVNHYKRHIGKLLKMFYLTNSESLMCHKLITKPAIMNSIVKRNGDTKILNYQFGSSNRMSTKTCYPFGSNCVVNVISEHCYHEPSQLFNTTYPIRCKVYRCEVNGNEISYCAACNSQAMFEVLRSLYDCYMRKTCDNCKCILCGHFFREKRRLKRLERSKTMTKLATATENAINEQIQKAEKAMVGKTIAEKEKILKNLAMAGIPLPNGKTASEKVLINKLTKNLGLPPPPKTAADKEKLRKMAESSQLKPLEGLTAHEKEKQLRSLAEMKIPLPEGRTASEKGLIQKVTEFVSEPPKDTISEKLRKAKAAGFLTPLENKPPEKQKRILKGLAMAGLPLPEVKSPSLQKLINEVRFDIGLPPEPKTAEMKEKYAKAADLGLMQPLEGQSPQEKERILKNLANMEIPLPTGRSPSEKALIANIKTEPRLRSIVAPSEKMRQAKAAGLLTPLKRKTPEQRENILKGLAGLGIPLPEGTTKSEKKLINKVRANLGLPPEPKTTAMRDKHAKAADAGLLQPLEGKSPKEKERILRGLDDMGIPLPEGRTPSEKDLINKIKTKAPQILTPSEKMRTSKAVGLITPLKGKTPDKKEKILKGIANLGIPLPKGTTDSEKKLINKVRANLGLPPEPKTPSMKDKHVKAAAAGLLQPLEGKTPKEKERILQGLKDIGIPLPEGRTPSEKALISKIKAEPRAPSILAPSERMRRAKTAGLLTPLQGKSPEKKENILKGLANLGIPLPEGTTDSERNLINKVRGNLGLPPGPKTAAMKNNHTKAAEAGFLQPLEGKSPKEKERILRGLDDMGIPLPEGRTPSEKDLITKIKAEPHAPPILAPSEKLRRAKVAGLITPLKGKTPEKRENILKGLANLGIPLPEGTTDSEKKLINKVRTNLGLPTEPKTSDMKDKHAKAADAGLLQPLEGKPTKEKERILRGLKDLGIPLPEGRSPSEKALISQIKGEPRTPSILAPSEKMRRAKVAGLLTPLKGKTPEKKEKLLKGLANLGIPLPEGTTDSEKKLINKVRADLGLPPEPKTSDMKDKHAKAAGAGLLQPLESKPTKEKERILRGLKDLGIPLPEGRSPSEKALISQIKAEPRTSSILAPLEKMHRAKVAGLLTPLKGKTPEKKENILKGLANLGILLPEGTTDSEKKLINKVRADLGLPPEPKTSSMKNKHAKAAEAGLLQPLEGKPTKEKERFLRGLNDLGIPLPEGRTPSEKALITNIKSESRTPSILAPSEKMRRAKVAGLITPLKGKTPEQREKILRGLANLGMPLPEGKTGSEKKLINKVRADLGLPPEPKTSDMKDKHAKAADAGLLQPLESKPTKEKERILRGLKDLGIPLPEGRSPSEKALISQIKAQPRTPSILAPSEKMHRAKVAGLLTPLKGKTPKKKEKLLKGLANLGIPLPDGTTDSEKKLINKVRTDLGLPPEPKTSDMKDKHAKAAEAGLLQPLESKPTKEKERILRGLKDLGIPLPEGRSPSEKALISQIKAQPTPSILAPLEKMRRAKVAGLITPLKGKTPEKKEKILKGLANLGIPLPEGTTDSEKKLINKVRADLGLPPEPKTSDMKDKHAKAADAGLLQPLESKPTKEKERILRGLKDLGIPLPEGRSPSEKALISQIKAQPRTPSILAPLEKMRRAKVAGLITPLKGKTPEKKEKILKGLANLGIPLPEGTTDSEKKLINKVRADLGLPPEPKTSDMKDKHAKAAEAGLLQPLESKPTKEKERILRGLKDLGIPLPEGRSPSEKALISQIKAQPRTPSILAPLEKMRRAKVAGLITPLKGKTPEKKEKILKGLANLGIPLPEGTTDSEKKLINKFRADLGLPPEPKTSDMKDKHAKAADAGLLQPLESKPLKEKERILRGLKDLGIPLPEGRSPSEKALISHIKAQPRTPSILAPSEKMHRAKVAGLLTPLKGKTPEKKEKILKGLANLGIPLPEGTTDSEKKLINKVRADLGLPPEPKTSDMKDKHAKAAEAGLLQPLESKPTKEKERILRGLKDLGIPLPEGRSPSEKALISHIKAQPRAPSILAPSEKMHRAKVAGLLTPLKGKTPEKKEKILKGLANLGIPLPDGTTDSEKKLINKVRADLGLPPEPKTSDMKDKHAKAADAGLLQPLESKPTKEKERILRGLKDLGIPLPEGRSPSEKALISHIKAQPRTPSILAPSEKMHRAKVAGLLTPLKGKTPEKKEKILKGLANLGIPLPEGTTDSEKKLINKVRADLGLPPEPKTSDMKDKHAKAADAGLLQPLESKPTKEKERILRGLKDLGVPLPEGRSPSEKALISYIKAQPRTPSILAPSEKMHRAKVAGLLTPLKGKTPEKKEKILKGLANLGIPLPEGTTDSEKKLINKVRADLGLPPEPKTSDMKDKHAKAADAGLLQPLESKPTKEKERILRGLKDLGIPLPEGRSPSEKALITNIKSESRTPSILVPSEKMRRAKVAGLITPLKGKTPEQKEKILRGLANLGMPLPEGKTSSEKSLVNKVRTNLGLPPEPTTSDMKDKHSKAANADLLQPLEGKTPMEKEKILRGLKKFGIPLPEGRTPSEKMLISKIKAESRAPSIYTPSETIRRAKAAIHLIPSAVKEGKKLVDECTCDRFTSKSKGEPVLSSRSKREPYISTPSERMRKAKAAGLLTPLQNKPLDQKEKTLKGLAMHGILLPEGTTSSEKHLMDKVRADLGLPPEPKTSTMRDKYIKATNVGLLLPLEGKTPKEKEKILRGLANIGIPLPEGRTPSEKALIAKVQKEAHVPLIPSEKMRKAKAAGLITPLEGKTPEQKEKILNGLAMLGIPLPEGTNAAEKSLVNKVRANLGLPPTPETSDMKEKHIKAAEAGLLQPLEGKPTKEKERILRGLADMGILLPEARTPSEKALVEKYKLAKRPPSITTEKLRKAKETGLLTPLEGKSQKDKEKILKGLAEAGLPLPEGRTPSDVALIKRIKTDFDIPDEKTEGKIRRAKITGFLTPIEGKTPEQKEKILRGRAAAGLPLPIGKTPSEKDLINKIKASSGYVTPSPSEKQKRAKAAGLITPIKGKTRSKKIKILKDMVAAGVPIPEGETPSDKELIKRITTPKKTKSEKMRDAKAAGFLTPLAGKTLEQKGEILRRLVKAGLPLPEAETPSEKNLIKKIRMETGLPPEPTTPSIKEKYKNAQVKGLITPLEGKLPAEKEDIIRKLEEAGIPLPEGRTASEKLMIKRIKKGTQKPDIREKKSSKAAVCDHACSCDKRKIKFKHSYVKITVISPDLSSICDCPDECLPKVPSGVVVDSDGIKVTISNVIGIPSIFSRDCTSTITNKVEKTTNHTIQTISRNIDRKILSFDNIHILFDYMYKKGKLVKRLNSVSSFEPYPSGDDSNYTRNKSASPMHIDDCNEDRNNCIYPYCHGIGEKGYFDYSRYFESMSDIQKSPVSCFSNTNFSVETTESSLTSVFIVKSVTSLSVTTSTESIYTNKSNSIISYTDDTATNLMQYSDTLSYGRFSDTTMQYSSSLTNGYCSEDATESDSNLYIRKLASVRRIGDEYNKYKKITQANIIILLPDVLNMIKQDSNNYSKSQNLQIGVVDR